MKPLLRLMLVFAALQAWAALPAVTNTDYLFTTLSRIPIHDPVMIREKGTYYLFATGMGIAVWSSKDMQHWKRERPVFASPPAWDTEAVPTFRGHTWAPHISARCS